VSGAPGDVRIPGARVPVEPRPRRVLGASVGAGVAGVAFAFGPTTGGCSGASVDFVWELA